MVLHLGVGDHADHLMKHFSGHTRLTSIIYIYIYICIYSRIKQFSKLHVSIKHINSVKSVKENKHSCVNFSSIAALEKQK